MIEKIYEKFIVKYLDKVKMNEELSKYHTFRIRGIASVVATPTSVDELIDMINICKENEYKFNVIGNGSNILFENGKYEGVLIVTKKLKNAHIDGTKITAECGISVPLLAQLALKRSLEGLERLSAIPGTIGGAVLMNAGAYGSEMKDVLTSVTILDEKMEIKKVRPEELELSYRHSNVKERGYIVLECEMQLKLGSQEHIKSIMDECKNKRLSSQPVEYPCAGSIFKKEGEHFAGKLIDDCGLKGFQVGGAMVSPKHANFIVNKEGATFKDVVDLITYIQQTVYIKNNVQLNTELEVI